MRKEYVVSYEEDGLKVLDFAYLKGINKRALKDIKMKGDILINNVHVTVIDKVKYNDKIVFCYPKEESLVEPWDKELKIVYEDDYLLVIDKPQGIACIPTRGHRFHTIANAIMSYYQKNHIEAAIHLVNRLDKDTSGLMIIAKYRDIHYTFSKNIKHIQRIYHAHVEGIVSEGTIDLPILKEEKKMKRIIDEEGKPSITHYQLIQSYDNYSLVKCVLETGRTHQIRVHMAAIGHPLVGDVLYGGKEGELYLESIEVSFVHPVTGKNICIKK